MKNTRSFFYLLVIYLLLGQAWAASTSTNLSNEKKLTVEKHPLYYTDQGKGDPIVLIHGLFANKEQWDSIIPVLATHYRVIALDLPGYGKSLGYPFEDYDLNRQVKLVHEFLAKLGVYRFHIAGNSMGGAIAYLYANNYPHDVLSLTFIGSPLGVTSPQQSESNLLFSKGVNPFLPTDKKGVDELMHLLFVRPPALSEKEINAIVEDNKKNFVKKNQMSKEVMEPYRQILDKPSAVKVPVFILWGEEDRIFDVSGADKLKQNFPSSYLVKLKGTGHLPHLDCAVTTANQYLQFLTSYKTTQPVRSIEAVCG